MSEKSLLRTNLKRYINNQINKLNQPPVSVARDGLNARLLLILFENLVDRGIFSQVAFHS
jgi:hypothetical protein